MGKYSYRAFGLNIITDIELPELRTGGGVNDVEISIGNIEGISNEFLDNRIYKAGPEEITYQLANIAACQVLNGNKAIVMPDPYLCASTLRLLVLTSVIGCILIQRKMTPIHGSSVVIGDGCIIIAGRSGAGKSTLTSAFIDKGFRFLSDDISVIITDNSGEMYVEPGYPYRKLHKDSAQYHSLNTEEFERIEYEDDKFLVPADRFFMDTPARLAALVEIVPTDTDSVSIKKLKGIAKLDTLMGNLYRGGLASYFKSSSFYFGRIGEIASKLSVFQLFRPKEEFTCNKQMELIMHELGIRLP